MPECKLKPIGYVKVKKSNVPRHWSVSDVEGEIVVDSCYKEGLKDIKRGDNIVVIFYFHKSPLFALKKLIQNPPHLSTKKGVFSTCSPHRPNPLGLSVFKVLDCLENIIKVKGIDVYNNTPILDIKLYIHYEEKQ